MRERTIAAITCSLLVFGAVLFTAVRGGAQAPQRPPSDDDYGYGYLTPEQRAGRDTWYFWTGGNEKFWIRMAGLPDTKVNLLRYVDSRLHGRRFSTLGAITQPGCRAATAPDQYGLWMDQCDQPPVPTIPGFTSSMGIRLVEAGRRTQPNAASATASRKTRIFMVCKPL